MANDMGVRNMENGDHSYRVNVGLNGRIFLPAKLRNVLNIEDDGVIFITEIDGKYVIETLQVRLAKARKLLQPFELQDDDVKPSEELINERRKEAF